MQKVGHETVRRSIKQFKRTTYNEDLVIKTNIRITWISQMQICFKPEFDEKNFYPIKDPVNHCSPLFARIIWTRPYLYFLQNLSTFPTNIFHFNQQSTDSRACSSWWFCSTIPITLKARIWSVWLLTSMVDPLRLPDSSKARALRMVLLRRYGLFIARKFIWRFSSATVLDTRWRARFVLTTSSCRTTTRAPSAGRWKTMTMTWSDVSWGVDWLWFKYVRQTIQ